jgi:Ca2+-binding EF-hand superfamily protein
MKFLMMICLMGWVSCAPGPGPVTPVSKVERQMVGFLEKFDRWDDNGDGRLTANELGEAEKLSGLPPERIIAFYDTNRDGAISLREAQAGLGRMDEAALKARR